MQCIGAEAFIDSPFIVRLTLEGEQRLSENGTRRERQKVISYDAFNFDGIIMSGGGDLDDRIFDKSVLQDALDALTPKQREIVNLYHDKGYSQQEIANMRGCSKQSVNECLTRAYRKMKGVINGSH